MADSSQERTEQATPRRAMEARRKGQVAKSTDLSNAAVMVAMLMILPGAIVSLGWAMIGGIRVSFANLPTDFAPAHLIATAQRVGQPALGPLAMIVGGCMLTGVVSNVGQVGFLLSAEAMVPNFNKLNPMNGLKRLFSPVAAFDGMKATIKTVVFGLVAYLALRSRWDDMTHLWLLPPIPAVSMAGGIFRTVAMRVVTTWGILAAVDYFFQRKQLEKNLKMTKEEVKQEMKDAEMKPEVKAQRMQRMRRLTKGRMQDAVKTADVIVTNPTHFAVALKYEPGKSYAPIVVAKGVDFLAARIREEAKKHEVPIVPNPPLARALYKQCEIGDPVPRELFQAVAEVLAYVYKTLKKVRDLR